VWAVRSSNSSRFQFSNDTRVLLGGDSRYSPNQPDDAWKRFTYLRIRAVLFRRWYYPLRGIIGRRRTGRDREGPNHLVPISYSDKGHWTNESLRSLCPN